MNSEAIDALPTAGAKDPGILRGFLVKRVIYPLGGAEDPEAFEALDGETGAIAEGLAWQSQVFWLDPDDTTSAHDGTTVLVTADGYRYKIPEYAGAVISALDKDLTAPPADPAFDDAYLVPAGATGAWSGHNDKIAIYTARGWKFVGPRIGRILHVEDEDAYYHWSSGGAWVAGFGDSLLSANSVLPENILGGRTHWVVENQTTNTPPAMPGDGVAYIVGPSPTGAWAGHAGKIAIARSSAWLIYAPAAGWQAFDRALAVYRVFRASAWRPVTGDPFSAALLHVRDEKASGTNGGTLTGGDWRTRTLNTVVTNEVPGASLSSNQVTLPAGTYHLKATAPAGIPANQTQTVKLRWRNITDGVDTLIGMSCKGNADDSSAGGTFSFLEGRFTIAAEKTFELQHRGGDSHATIGFGVAAGFGVVEVYADVMIWQVG